MENAKIVTEKAYSTKDLSNMIGVETVTIRKYATALESHDYKIMRDKNDRRIFVERDVMAFQYLKQLLKKTGMSVEKCAEIVVTRFEKQASDNVSPSDTAEKKDSGTSLMQYDERYNDMMTKLTKLEEGLSQLQELKKIDGVMKKMDEMAEQLRVQQELNNRLMEYIDQKEKKKKRWFFF